MCCAHLWGRAPGEAANRPEAKWRAGRGRSSPDFGGGRGLLSQRSMMLQPAARTTRRDGWMGGWVDPMPTYTHRGAAGLPGAWGVASAFGIGRWIRGRGLQRNGPSSSKHTHTPAAGWQATTGWPMPQYILRSARAQRRKGQIIDSSVDRSGHCTPRQRLNGCCSQLILTPTPTHPKQYTAADRPLAPLARRLLVAPSLAPSSPFRPPASDHSCPDRGRRPHDLLRRRRRRGRDQQPPRPLRHPGLPARAPRGEAVSVQCM